MDPGFLDRVAAAITAVATWTSGEVGRALVAGAMGGVARWIWAERYRLRDGVIAVVTGAVSAFYLSPLFLGVLRSFGIDLGDGADADRVGGFLAGVGGMSIAKIAVAAIEARLTRNRGGTDGQP